MNDGVTISTFQLFQLFPNQESARLYRKPPSACDCGLHTLLAKIKEPKE